jgi:hypothetical protein
MSGLCGEVVGSRSEVEGRTAMSETTRPPDNLYVVFGDYQSVPNAPNVETIILEAARTKAKAQSRADSIFGTALHASVERYISESRIRELVAWARDPRDRYSEPIARLIEKFLEEPPP